MAVQQADFVKRSERQNRAVINLFKGPNEIEYISNTMSRMENGELKIRVRALEAERALSRVEANQSVRLSHASLPTQALSRAFVRYSSMRCRTNLALGSMEAAWAF